MLLALHPAAAAASCPAPSLGGVSEQGIRAALASGRDAWGERLLDAPQGPTLAGARRFLAPLLLARGPGQTPLTDSGVYYVPFGQPDGPRGAGTVALHVADGSQIIAQRVGGRTLTILVGPSGSERYGSCLARLVPARFAGGYLPILETRYRDAVGVRYRQESFVARIPQTRSLVELHPPGRRRTKCVDGYERASRSLGLGLGRLARRSATERPRSSSSALEATRAPVGSRTASPPGHSGRSSPRGSRRRVGSRDSRSTQPTYVTARASVQRYWDARLASATAVSVPEPTVLNALRATLIQSLMLTWRYSIGNPYEQFSFPESPDTARVLAEYGFDAAVRSVLRTSLSRDEERYRSWKRGSRLVALAAYTNLTGDPELVRRATPALSRWVADFARQLDASENGLLAVSATRPTSPIGCTACTRSRWSGRAALDGRRLAQ